MLPKPIPVSEARRMTRSAIMAALTAADGSIAAAVAVVVAGGAVGVVEEAAAAAAAVPVSAVGPVVPEVSADAPPAGATAGCGSAAATVSFVDMVYIYLFV